MRPSRKNAGTDRKADCADEFAQDAKRRVSAKRAYDCTQTSANETATKSSANSASKKSGDYSREATPVPISNTVVKLLCADDTWRAAAWESRTSPVWKDFPDLGKSFLYMQSLFHL